MVYRTLVLGIATAVVQAPSAASEIVWGKHNTNEMVTTSNHTVFIGIGVYGNTLSFR